METKQGFREIFLRLVAIVGLLAVLVLGAWGIILLAFNLVGILNGTVSVGGLFNRDNVEQVATTTPTVTVNNNNQNTNPQPTTAVRPTTPTTPTTPSTNQPTVVYNAAPRAPQLYGLSDLKVVITSVTSLSSVQGRTVVQFTISNVGTNVAHAGWTFKADLPTKPTYTYQSVPQQALYPGDSIAYTLTYDVPNYQYPYNYQYVQPQTCYTYNGYQNIPGPCPMYDSNGNLINYSQNYNYNQNYYNPNYGYYPYGGTVTVVVDQFNMIPEANEYNNTASRNVY